MSFSVKRLVLASASIGTALLLGACGGSQTNSGVKDTPPGVADAAAAADPSAAFDALQAEGGYHLSQEVSGPATPTGPAEDDTAPVNEIMPFSNLGAHYTIDAWVSPSLDASAIRVRAVDGSATPEVSHTVQGKVYTSLESLPASLQVKAKGLRFPVRVFLFDSKTLGRETGVVTELPTDGSQPTQLMEMMDCDPMFGGMCLMR